VSVPSSMSYSIEPGDSSDSVRIVCHEKVSRHEILAAMGELSVDGTFQWSQRLWDFRGCKLLLQGEDFRHIGERAKALRNGEDRVVILVDSDLAYGIARIQQVYREDDQTRYRVVRDEAEAVSFLRAV